MTVEESPTPGRDFDLRIARRVLEDIPSLRHGVRTYAIHQADADRIRQWINDQGRDHFRSPKWSEQHARTGGARSALAEIVGAWMRANGETGRAWRAARIVEHAAEVVAEEDSQ